MRWLVVALIFLASGCGAGKATVSGNSTSLAQSRLSQAETRAAGFAKSGDYQNAARQYGEALRIATTLENADAIAGNAINLSVVQQWLGRDADARAALDGSRWCARLDQEIEEIDGVWTAVMDDAA